MIIENNRPGNINNFNNQNRFRNTNQATTPTTNNFENRWNTIQEHNKNRQITSNGFVKNIQDHKYSNTTDTSSMQDKTLAMLHERLKQGTISIDEFNKKCIQLGKQRQNMSKNNKLF